MAASPDEVAARIRATLAAAGAAAVAIGWATVELDRAAAELTAALGLPADAFEPADDSITLGAFCRIARGVLAGGRSLLILEPNTEGRVVASLVRLDEGPAAVWLDAIPHGAAVSAPQPGPLGPERLLLGDPIHGPHRLVVTGGPGTIAP